MRAFPSLAMLLACTSLLAAPAARADDPQDIQLSYTVQLDRPGPAITRLMTFNNYANGGGVWWAAEVPAGETQWTITDPFLKSSANAPLSALLLGLVQDLPGDAAGQQHVVLMMDSAAAAAATNVAWGTLFRNTSEAQLIAAIELATSGQDGPLIDPAFDILSAFVDGDATSGILVPPGQALSAWFTLGTVVPGSTTFSGFTVMAFSDGQVLGSGQALVTGLALAVPEPLMAIVGLAMPSNSATPPVRSELGFF